MVDDSTYWALRTVAVVQQVKKGVVVFRNLPLRSTDVGRGYGAPRNSKLQRGHMDAPCVSG